MKRIKVFFERGRIPEDRSSAFAAAVVRWRRQPFSAWNKELEKTGELQYNSISLI